MVNSHLVEGALPPAVDPAVAQVEAHLVLPREQHPGQGTPHARQVGVEFPLVEQFGVGRLHQLGDGRGRGRSAGGDGQAHRPRRQALQQQLAGDLTALVTAQPVGHGHQQAVAAEEHRLRVQGQVHVAVPLDYPGGQHTVLVARAQAAAVAAGGDKQPAHGSSRKVNEELARVTAPPSMSSWRTPGVRRTPAMKVPPVEPRSSTYQRPPSQMNRAWRREI